jgi:N-methylhydantoinase A
LVDQIEACFHRRHEELYTYSSPGQEVVFVNARVAAVGEVSQRGEGAKVAAQVSSCEPMGTRKAYFGGWRDVPVYAFDKMQPGHSLEGPAIIEAETTTVLIDIGDRVTVNALGWLDIALR